MRSTASQATARFTASHAPSASAAESRCAVAVSDQSAELLLLVVVVHCWLVEIRHREMSPWVHPEAWVAPTAVLSGQVRVGPGSCVLHGAVLTADGGRLEVGASCVIMEHAVLRATARHQLVIGDHVLAGPHCYLTGCRVGDEVFIATGAMVFNGAQLGQAASVALGGAVHIGCVVPPQTRIPIGWVAVGDPARLYPPGDVDLIRAGLEEAGGFLPFVFGADPAADRSEQMRTAMRRYAGALARHHRGDQEIPDREHHA